MFGGIGFADILATQSHGQASLPFLDQPTRGPLRGLAELRQYEAVRKFQRYFNSHVEEIKAAAGLERIYELGVDGKYGSNTNYGMWLYSEWKQSEGDCLGSLPVTVRNLGPNTARACLISDGFTDAEVDQLQQAFREYRAADSASDPVVEEDAGGQSPVVQPKKQEKESSIWPWVLGGGALLALGLIIWKAKKR